MLYFRSDFLFKWHHIICTSAFDTLQAVSKKKVSAFKLLGDKNGVSHTFFVKCCALKRGFLLKYSVKGLKNLASGDIAMLIYYPEMYFE